MPSKLQRLLREPLSLRSLWKIETAALEAAEEAASPLGYFLVASIVGSIAMRMEGEPVSADLVQVRGEVVLPALARVIDAAEAANAEQLVAAANEAIRGYLLSQ
ncbi:MAG: hypothetical protein WBI63_03345 [Coriobacteriia bacterium]